MEDFRGLIARAMMDADEDFVLLRDILNHIWKHHTHRTDGTTYTQRHGISTMHNRQCINNKMTSYDI